MKDVAKKLSKKLFTREDKNIIINEKYNPLKVNFKLIYEREGLCVNKTKDVLLNEITKELNLKEIIILKIFKKTFYKVANLTRITVVNNLIR